MSVVSLAEVRRDRELAVRLASDLCVAQETIHQLVELLKDCHADQMHKGTALAIRLAVAIREQDDTWLPTTTRIGKDPAKR